MDICQPINARDQHLQLQYIYVYVSVCVYLCSFLCPNMIF